MTEIWAEIKGYEGRYAVSNKGRVKSLPFEQRYLLRNGVTAWRKTRTKLIALHPNNRGYLLVHLYKDGRRQAVTVHKLVADAFLPAGKGEINHKDGDKTNNHADNLEYTTSSENKTHAVSIGLNKQAIPVEGKPLDGSPAEIYPSAAEAALALTGKRHNGTKISACLRGSRRTAFGRTWGRA